MDMDIIWTALGVCVLVGFVFYVLAQYWQRLLRAHSHALRDLTARVQALEEMEDPGFRQKVGESVPSPLEQVYTFTLPPERTILDANTRGFTRGNRLYQGQWKIPGIGEDRKMEKPFRRDGL